MESRPRRWLGAGLLIAAMGLLATAMVGSTSAATTTVTTSGFTFSQSTVNVSVGDTVHWTNLSGHTVTTDTGPWPRALNFTNVSTADSDVFTQPGTYTYYCAIHGAPGGVGMSGTIVVGQAATTTPTQAATNTPTATPTAAALSNVVSATLLGASQVPTVTTGAIGRVRLTLDASTGTITGQWAISGLSSNATAAHIHTGAAGTNGSVLVDVSSQVPAAGGSFTTTTAGISAATINSILANPSGFYVNVHTSNNPAGEIRGQLAPIRTYFPILLGNAAT